MRVVVSLYDYTGIAVVPWAAAGYDCYCFDNQHTDHSVEYPNGGRITYRNVDLHGSHQDIVSEFAGRTAFMSAFPVCTDLAISGAAHFATKLARDPDCQKKAAWYARQCELTGLDLGAAGYIENPISVLSTLWRKPDYIFNPYEYGGYIDEADAEHPTWPDYIAPRDAYPKKTCLWTFGGFVMPKRKPVPCPAGYSTQHNKLGGKSLKTKNIRSATPRGFVAAVKEYNS